MSASADRSPWPPFDCCSICVHRLGKAVCLNLPDTSPDVMLALAQRVPAFRWPMNSWTPVLLESLAVENLRRMLVAKLDVRTAVTNLTTAIHSAAEMQPRFEREIVLRLLSQPTGMLAEWLRKVLDDLQTALKDRAAEAAKREPWWLHSAWPVPLNE